MLPAPRPRRRLDCRRASGPGNRRRRDGAAPSRRNASSLARWSPAPFRSRRDDDFASHMRVEPAIVVIFAGLVEGDLERIVSVERLRVELARLIHDGMGYIIVVDESHRRTWLDREDIRREGEIVDHDLVFFADRQGQGGSEQRRDERRRPDRALERRRPGERFHLLLLKPKPYRSRRGA